MSSAEPTDAELVVAARRSGEAPGAAFRALYERHRSPVFSFLARFLRDKALAEDALQETFLRVYRNLDDFEIDRPFRSWLFQIARHVAIDAIRARRKEDRVTLAKARDSEPGTTLEPSSELERDESQSEARAVLDELPDDARALLMQRHGLGMTLDELAESWSCTEKTVRNRLRAAAGLLGNAVAALARKGDRR